jgi:hypothetical protein
MVGLVNTNYGGTPDNWVANVENLPTLIWVYTGSVRVGVFNALSPTGYWEDAGFVGATITPGIQYRLTPYGGFPFAIPTSPSYNNYASIQTYSGPNIAYQAGRTDYVRPYRDYSGDPFSDVANNSPEAYPTSRLYSLGITTGTAPGYYDPGSPVPRYQMATFIARAMGWQYEEWWDYTFSDIGWLPYEHQRHIRALAHYGVARGYEPATCAAFGRAYPCFVPEDNITNIQTIAFISRANVAKLTWGSFPDDPAVYPGVPAAHRQDATIYVKNSAAAPDTDIFSNWYWNSWATNRGWYARALWEALP